MAENVKMRDLKPGMEGFIDSYEYLGEKVVTGVGEVESLESWPGDFEDMLTVEFVSDDGPMGLFTEADSLFVLSKGK